MFLTIFEKIKKGNNEAFWIDFQIPLSL